MIYEVKVFADGEEIPVSEVEEQDSGDPTVVKLVVRAWKDAE